MPFWSPNMFCGDRTSFCLVGTEHVKLAVYVVPVLLMSYWLCFVIWLCSEENVWKLCEFVSEERTAPLAELLVVFISNENRMVRTWSC